MVRPIQLWEVGFPEEYRDIMMQTIFQGQKQLGKHQSDWKGNIALNFLRKAVNANPIKNWDETKGFLPLTREGMSVMGIGERKDKMNYHPQTGKPNEGV